MPVSEMIALSPGERDLVVKIARAMRPFERDIASRWHALCERSGKMHTAGAWTVRGFQHAVWLLLTSLEDGNFTGYLRRVQRTGAAFARNKDRYDTLVLFFCFYEEAVRPFLGKSFQGKIDLIIRTLEHLYHGLIAVMSRAYFLELERDRERFLSTLIHDIQNPLIGVSAFAEMMTKKNLPKEKEEKFLRIIRDSGKKASSLIDHALTYGRLKSGKASLTAKDVDIVEVVREAATLFLPEIEKRELAITINQKRAKDWNYLAPLRVKTDRDLLLRAVGNYLSNAVKYARERIAIVVKESEGGIQISVRDDGSGIPAGKLSRIFENYYRVPGGKPGIGIGLASVKMIADLCEGKAWAESDHGSGSTFHFLLPAKQGDGRSADP